jgi:hypothetical protein
MIFDYSLAALVAAGLLGYLLYAHVPETPPSRTTARCCQKL